MKRWIVAAAAVILAAFVVPAFAATNPFMDVPASHWAYDAVAQLASRGVISGYPDGAYKGQQRATRYEMASIVARAMAKIDMEKASKQDVEMLKKLIVEFKDELDALGVKVDKIDSRLAVLEKDLGGWSISGEFRFDANFGMNESTDWYADDMAQAGKNDFDLNRYRIFLNKRINETTSFHARLGAGDRGATGGAGVEWEHYYITTKLGYDIEMTVGRNEVDWEGDLGLVGDNDPLVGTFETNMFCFKKDWGMANLQLVIGRVEDAADLTTPPSFANNDWAENLEQFYVAGLADFSFTEKFRGGVMAYYFWADDEPTGVDADLLTAGVYLGYAFTPDIELKAVYYHQSMGDSYANAAGGNDDDASAWKLALEVGQEALKFTSVWLEYGQMDNHFVKIGGAVAYTGNGADLLANRYSGAYNNNTAKFYGINTQQEWNDKWRTFARFFAVDYDTTGVDDAYNWTLGVGYRLNPAVDFELSYDSIDYGNSSTGNNGGRVDDDHQIRFRTFVSF